MATYWQPQVEGVQAQLEAADVLPPSPLLAGAAMTEYCIVWCRPPHFGQTIVSLALITSLSNGFLQSSQTYS